MGCKASNLCTIEMGNSGTSSTIKKSDKHVGKTIAWNHEATKTSKSRKNHHRATKTPKESKSSTNSLLYHAAFGGGDVVNCAIEVCSKTCQFVFNPSKSPNFTCVLTLKHPGTGATINHIAFRIRTNQSRRRLGGQTFGIISPNSTKSVTIRLSKKGKEMLLQSSDIDCSTCNDKIHIESFAVGDDFAKSFIKKRSEMKKSIGGNTDAQNRLIVKELFKQFREILNVARSGEYLSIYEQVLQARYTIVRGEDGRNATKEGAMGGPRDGSTPGPFCVQPTAPSLDQQDGLYAQDEDIVEATLVIAEEEVVVIGEDIVVVAPTFESGVGGC